MKPCIVYWRLRFVVLTSILGPPEFVETAAARDRNGASANRAVLRHHVPYGATGWSEKPDGPWRDIGSLPAEWGLTTREGT